MGEIENNAGWRIREFFLLVLILFQILDFFELLDPFWDYIKKIISWALILSLLYHVSPSRLFFGKTTHLWDGWATVAFFSLSLKNVVSFAASARAAMQENIFDFVRFIPVESTTSELTIPVSDAALNTFMHINPYLPNASAYAKAFATQLTLTSSNVPVILIAPETTAGAFLQPYGMNGMVLQLYNTILNNATIIEFTSFLFGVIVLVLLAGYAAFKINNTSPSILSLFHEEGTGKNIGENIIRWCTALFVSCAFFVMFFNFLVEWLAIAIDAPVAMAAIAFYLYAGHRSKRSAEDNFLNTVGNFGSNFIEKFGNLFTNWKTLPIGISGLLVLHLLTDIGVFMIPYTLGLQDILYFQQLGAGHDSIVALMHSQLGTWTENVVLFWLYTLNIIGAFFLLCLPAYMWYKTYRIRIRHETEPEHQHHPKLDSWLIALGITSVAAFLAKPAFALQQLSGAFVGVDFQTQAIIDATPMAAISLLCLLILVGILSLKENIRRYLMALLFFAGLLFFAYYTYTFFMSSVRYHLQEGLSLLLTGGAASFIGLWLFLFMIINLLFYVFGFFSFMYELARD